MERWNDIRLFSSFIQVVILVVFCDKIKCPHTEAPSSVVHILNAPHPNTTRRAANVLLDLLTRISTQIFCKCLGGRLLLSNQIRPDLSIHLLSLIYLVLQPNVIGVVEYFFGSLGV
ncbi:hypothetical protein A0H81_04620 [Grifola frondosa]|uniref:Uncharacterized protein n=1 Tax=Grifola frondosa TaxID=5627 RepID=A0A1C7MEB3_GRIFR|nr:hypothetical protein A0H81_04620 [Grifola frondosa]